MNRPDDVSAEAWEVALKLQRSLIGNRADGITIADFNENTVILARAIDAAIAKERERAAKKAEAYPFRRWEQDEPDKSVFGWGRCRSEIAKAIRSGK